MGPFHFQNLEVLLYFLFSFHKGLLAFEAWGGKMRMFFFVQWKDVILSVKKKMLY